MTRIYFLELTSNKVANLRSVIANFKEFTTKTMLPNSNEQQPIKTQIGVPPQASISYPPRSQAPTLYDYFALLPVLITAATPLILGWRKKDSNFDEDKANNK